MASSMRLFNNKKAANQDFQFYNLLKDPINKMDTNQFSFASFAGGSTGGGGSFLESLSLASSSGSFRFEGTEECAFFTVSNRFVMAAKKVPTSFEAPLKRNTLRP